MEHPLFKDNVTVFDAYLAALSKHVAQRIADYHIGGTGHHDLVMPAGMPAFGQSEAYTGILFEFRRGASMDFSGASILIGKKGCCAHWMPAKAHVSPLQISSPAAIDAEIAECGNALKSGTALFIGGWRCGSKSIA